jgi:hypothetical protein
MNLLIQYFKSKHPEREAEYITCLQENINNKFIHKIHVFLETNTTPPINHPKLHYINLNKRCTYDDFFKYSNENLDGQNCIISNSDIIFDDSLIHFTDFNLENYFICLTRWNITKEDGLRYYNEPCSQDTWIFKSPLPTNFSCSLYLGTPGCDNFVAYLATKAGLITNNPSLLIITRHLHLTNYRTYKSADRGNGFVEHLYPTNSLNIISKKEYLEI